MLLSRVPLMLFLVVWIDSTEYLLSSDAVFYFGFVTCFLKRFRAPLRGLVTLHAALRVLKRFRAPLRDSVTLHGTGDSSRGSSRFKTF